MNTIRTKIRVLLGDTSTRGVDIFTYGSSNVFTLTETNIISIISVSQNDIDIGDSSYSFDSTTNKVTINSALTSGDTIEIKYTYYANYSITELTDYIQAALVHLSVNNYFDFIYDNEDDAIYPEPSTGEENLIATIASILIDPQNRTIRLPDITISVSNNLSTTDLINRAIKAFKRSAAGSSIFEILDDAN